MKVGKPRSRHEVVRLQEGITAAERGYIFDSFREVYLPVGSEEWELVSLLGARGSVSSADLAPRQRAALESLGEELVLRQRALPCSDETAWARRWLGPQAGGPRRIRAPNSVWLPLQFMWCTIVSTRWVSAFALVAAGTLVGSLGMPASFAVGPVVPLAVVYWPVSIHELGHLMALRRVRRRPALGGLWRGRSGLAILRPPLAGIQLRVVSAAGPACGCVAALVVLPLRDRVPGVVGGVVVAVAFHLFHLLPLTGDGRALWSGSDRESAVG